MSDSVNRFLWEDRDESVRNVLDQKTNTAFGSDNYNKVRQEVYTRIYSRVDARLYARIYSELNTRLGVFVAAQVVEDMLYE